MITKIFATLAVATSMLFAASIALAGQNDAEPSVTEQVLTHHLESFGAGNVDEILSDYTEDSVIIIPDGVLKGKEQIRGLFDALTAEFGAPDTKFELTDTKIEGPVAYITWVAETQVNVYSYATDTFYIADGKIAYQTLGMVATPKN